MRYTVKDLPPLIPTSSGSSFTNFVGKLDDADSITIYVSSSADTASTGAGAPLLLQTIQFDPNDPFPLTGVGISLSSAVFSYSLTTTTGGVPLLSTGAAVTIPNISFRGFRLANLTSAVVSEIIATVSKQIAV
jgi:hypothetical protein